MTRHLRFAAFMLVVLSIAACAPAAAPPPAVPTPAPGLAPPSPSPTSRLSLPTSQDAAWQKVIDAAKQEGRLVIYASATFGGPVARDLASAFETKHGIKVEMLIGSGRGNEERITVEQTMKKPVADVMQAGLSSLVVTMSKGFTKSLAGELPSLRDKSVFTVDPVYSPDGSVLSFVTSAFSPMINTKLVKPGELRSYRDFLDPKWKGKIVIEDPKGGGGTGFAWWAAMKYFKILEDDYWPKLGAQMHFFGGGALPMYQLVGRGEYAFAASSSDTSVAPLIAEGAPLKMVEMEEGTYVQTINIGALAQSAHPNAARLFIDWLFSQEGQTVYAKAASSAPLRKDVPDFSIGGVIGQPKKILYRDWKATEAFDSYQKQRLAEKLFGAK